jgi:Raf kinase inhibitor-like YbhB/YbcL family protein
MKPAKFFRKILGEVLSPLGASARPPLWERTLLPLGLSLILCAGCKKDGKKPEPADPGVKIALTSPAFKEGEALPREYTGDGKDQSPPLKWGEVPRDTKSLVLLCEDPDAPGGTFVHWVLFNLPPEPRELPAGVPTEKELPSGARQGKNDFDKIGYGGPKPPSGQTHRYEFKLYALDQKLDLPAGATRDEVVKAMKGHVLAMGKLVGKYSR